MTFTLIPVSPLIYNTPTIKPIQTGHLRWVKKRRNEQIPHDALIGGYENGEVLYIARVKHVVDHHITSLIPGKYVPSQQCAIIGYGLHTTKKNTCEVS